MSIIRFGPAGLGPIKEAVGNLEEYHRLGFKACEIAFTYGVYIKNEFDIKKIREASEKLGIRLSIHAHYWINLNSKEKRKIEESKTRILECLEIGEKLGAYRVVFHPGFYQGMDKEETYQNIKREILELQKKIKENKWKIKLAPETTGKINVFGSIEEISRLVKETDCSFCIDFAHILAREKKVDYEKIKKNFGKYEIWHIHFSGIEYSDKGERKHINTKKEEWTKLLKELPKNKDLVIINESPSTLNDSVEGLKLYKNL
jgi:deoxyribonuclease IV